MVPDPDVEKPCCKVFREKELNRARNRSAIIRKNYAMPEFSFTGLLFCFFEEVSVGKFRMMKSHPFVKQS